MSNRQRAATAAKSRRKAEAVEQLRDVQLNSPDRVFGITHRYTHPGGGQRRFEVVWRIPSDDYMTLVALDRLRRGTLAGVELEAVAGMRARGDSWALIGQALQITGEGARLKFADKLDS